MSVDAHRSEHAGRRIVCAVITCSDTRTRDNDTSGQLIVDLLEAAGHVIAARRIVPDDPEALAVTLDELAPAVDAMLITGGTGLSPRDNAPDVVERRLDRILPGFGELFRMLSWDEIGPAAMLSRAVAGVDAGTFVVSMPGSTAAVRLAMERLILPELRHVVGLIEG